MNRARFILIPSLLLLSACLAAQAPAPFTNYGAGTGGGSTGVHTVTQGETLWTISKRYRMEMRDIAMLNRLSPPFDLPPGTRLRLPPPQEYTVRDGDTLYKVSRLFNASNSDIVRLNNLPSPYALNKGMVLRMPSPKPPPAEFFTASAPQPSYDPAQPVMAVAQNNYEPVQGVTQPPVTPYQPPSGIESEVLAAPVTPSQTATQQSAPVKVASSQQTKTPSPVQPPVKAQQVSYQPEQVKAVKQKITTATPKRSGSSKFQRPVSGRILSGYGPKPDGLHNDGINIRAAKGTPIRAAENGVVVYAGNELKGSGNLVLIRHEGRWMTAYAHMDGMNIKRGDTVKRGQVIGTVGDTGSVTEPQLHFEVRRGTEAINPDRFLEG